MLRGELVCDQRPVNHLGILPLGTAPLPNGVRLTTQVNQWLNGLTHRGRISTLEKRFTQPMPPTWWDGLEYSKDNCSIRLQLVGPIQLWTYRVVSRVAEYTEKCVNTLQLQQVDLHRDTGLDTNQANYRENK